MKQKLNAKDFILIGILTALMWIICMIISTIMSVAGPVTNVFYPSVVAIPNGIVMMLLLAKVPKKGVFTICAAIQAILFLLVGAFWFIPIGLVIGGVICDFLIMGRNEITMKSMMAAYALFSAIFAFSAIDAVLNALELSDYRERHPASLSGGQKQRVTIGVAIVKDSPVIYFDEPTSGLDYDSMVRVSKLIEQLSDSGVIVFVVSHDFEFIVRTCTEVVQLDDDGTIQNQQLSPTVLKSLSEKYFT